MYLKKKTNIPSYFLYYIFIYIEIFINIFIFFLSVDIKFIRISNLLESLRVKKTNKKTHYINKLKLSYN